MRSGGITMTNEWFANHPDKLKIPDVLLTEGRTRWVQLSYQMHLDDPNTSPSTVVDFNP